MSDDFSRKQRLVKDIEVSGDLSVSDLVERLGETSYNARKLFEAADIWLDAVKAKTRIYFTLAGAMTPAGMRRVIAQAIENKFIHVLATTGANMVHDAIKGRFQAHMIGTENADDAKLFKERLFRIYDIFLSNDRWAEFGDWLDSTFFPSFLKEKGGARGKPAKGAKPNPGNKEYEEVRITPTQFFEKLGKELLDGNDNGVLAAACKHKVPVYCPAFVDCDYGIRLHFANLEVLQPKYNSRLMVDMVAEYDKLFEDMQTHKNRAIIIVGGGTPKNFVLQTSMALPDIDYCGFKFAAQVTTDAPQWGGLSGATLREAMSWGKIKEEARTAICYSDATVALPLMVAYMMAKMK
ncbi:MAG: deoxyhypusine synthase family protein [Candidatus Atabeyarchaeum deiterrae]